MNALLHYAWLKGLRDRSLLAFGLLPAAQVAATLIVMPLVERTGLHYPLTSLPWREVKQFPVLMSVLVAIFTAFWTFRSEIQTKAVSSFVVGSSAITFTLALLILAIVTAIIAMSGGMLTAVLLMASVPDDLARVWTTGALFSIVGASIGLLCVTVSPQPMMLAGTWILVLPFLGMIMKAATPTFPLAALCFGAAIATLFISTLLVRRRCST